MADRDSITVNSGWQFPRSEPGPDGLVMVRYASGFVDVIYDRDYYALYLEKTGAIAALLDRSSWPEEMSLESFEHLADAGHCPRYTYFAVAERTRRIKIGMSYDLNQRANALSWEQSEPIKILATLRGYVFEYMYHDAFADHRIEGEWFSPHPDILAEIDRINSKTPCTACGPVCVECAVRGGS